MRVIEITDPGGAIQFVLVDEDGVLQREISITGSTVEVEGRIVPIIYGTDMSPISAMSRFFIQQYEHDAENTILQAMTALKLLAAYQEIRGIDFGDFDERTATAFLLFLQGNSHEGILYSYSLSSTRCQNTIGAYLKVYRRYARFLNLEGRSPFLDKSLNHKGFNEAYRISANDAESFEAPLFISLEEYRKILHFIGQAHDGQSRVIIRLMFEHGLRIGEVLGLTIEDICSCVHKGVMRYYVEVRNRASDTRDRRAKRMLNTKTESTYRGSDYNKRNVGYQRVYISEDLYTELICCVERNFCRLGDKFQTRRDVTAMADAIRKNTEIEGNYYVFLNSLGRPLTANLWGKRLRRFMRECGLHVDQGKKQTNLSHRFRHGYITVLKRVLHKDDYTTMTLARHKSLSSTEVYDNPTAEQIAELQIEVIDEWAEVILG